MTNLNDIVIRNPDSNDLNFIFDSFKISVLKDSKLGKSCRVSIFVKEFPKVIDHILATAQIAIACVKDEPSVIIGYILYAKDVIHYCFVKEPFRKLRIAYLLMAYAFGIEDRQLQCSIITETAKKILRVKQSLKIEYNPFLLFHRSMA